MALPHTQNSNFEDEFYTINGYSVTLQHFLSHACPVPIHLNDKLTAVGTYRAKLISNAFTDIRLCMQRECVRQNGARQITRLAIRVIACVNCVCFGAPIYIIIHGRRWGSKHLNQGHTTNWLRLLYQCKIIWDTPSFFYMRLIFSMEKVVPTFSVVR